MKRILYHVSMNPKAKYDIEDAFFWDRKKALDWLEDTYYRTPDRIKPQNRFFFEAYEVECEEDTTVSEAADIVFDDIYPDKYRTEVWEYNASTGYCRTI